MLADHGLVLEKLATRRPTYRRIGLHNDGRVCMRMKEVGPNCQLQALQIGEKSETLEQHYLLRQRENVDLFNRLAVVFLNRKIKIEYCNNFFC